MDLHCNAPKAVEPVPKQPVVVEMLPPPAPAKAKEPVPKQPVVVEKVPPPAPAKAEAPVLAAVKRSFTISLVRPAESVTVFSICMNLRVLNFVSPMAKLDSA